MVVDEAQDMGTQAFRLIRALVPSGPDDLFIVGDGHQRIYGRNKVVLGQCGIDIRGRSARLKVNYRTTDETRRLAVSILEGVEVDDLDGGRDRLRLGCLAGCLVGIRTGAAGLPPWCSRLLLLMTARGRLIWIL